MLNNASNREFNSIFHHYFDRNNNFNCYVTFNFLEFIKSQSEFPQIYNQKILERLQFRFYLQNEDKTSIKEIKNISKYNLFSNESIITFFLMYDTENIKGNYQVKCTINFEDEFYNFINNTPISEASEYFNLTEYEYVTIVSQLKPIMDTKYINQFKPSNLAMVYEFFSDFINFYDKDVKISNLFDIYKNSINFETYSKFIQDKESEKQYTYDSTLPITKYIKDQKIYDLVFNLEEKKGNLNNYLDLSLSLLNNSKNRDDYKKTSSSNNIFLKNAANTNIKKASINPYNFIDSLQSTACETNIFADITIELFKDSDILYITTFLDNYDFLKVDDFWTSNYENMPVYLLDIATKYTVYYLEKIDENSMYEDWKLLTKGSLNSLKQGKYLCMICADRDYVSKELIENYFILEK